MSVRPLLLSLSMCLLATTATGKTAVVGSCLSNLQRYATISQAVSAVPPSSTILVCPGNYPEQIIIHQALTLRGVPSANASNPTITVPAGGLSESVVLGNGVR